MSLEQLAILGIAIFGFIVVVHAFNTVRAIKKASRRGTGGRTRRLVGGDAAARATAEGLVREVAAKHEALAAQARETGRLPAELEAPLQAARTYYLDRVEKRHKPLFNRAVDAILLGRDGAETPTD